MLSVVDTAVSVGKQEDVHDPDKKWLLLFFHSVLPVEDLLDKNQSRFSAFAAQLNRIEDAVNRTRQPHNAPSARSRQDMHPNTRALFDREDFIDELVSLLAAENTSRVCSTGAGGMGETSVALAMAESPTIVSSFKKEYIFWIPCIEAKPSDLLRIRAESFDSLDSLITELSVTQKPRLLLLNKIETPWLSAQD
ncbi:hypothetical protein R3P38DRAFT_3263184 [Favolaschia claudopus]|uniref:Uncharacterized protein n=1 Tax=Favolaschia claudopus TaxID=2862362 RepID=A0AAW0C8F5_9AGAR